METRLLPRIDAPSYRWDLICQLVEENRAPGRRPEDKILRDGFHFLKRLNQGSGASYLQLLGDYPELYRAYSLYQNDTSVKWIIEAGLLSPEVKLPELSEYVGQSVPVIETYGAYFYDVRPRLGAKGFIYNEIMAPAISRGLADRDYDCLYKLLAYAGGFEVLRAFIEAKELDPKAKDFLNNTFRDKMLKNAWTAAHRVDINQFTSLKVIEQFSILERNEKELGTAGESQDEAKALVRALLNQCAMTIMPSTVETVKDEPRVSAMLGMHKQKSFEEPLWPEQLEGVAHGKTQ